LLVPNLNMGRQVRFELVSVTARMWLQQYSVKNRLHCTLA